MSDTTTIRVGRNTREALNRISADSGRTVDAVIQRALGALELEQRRQSAVQQSLALVDDAADRAEIHAAIKDLVGE